MNWSDVTSALKSVGADALPAIGQLVAGGIGQDAGKALASVLGCDPTPDAVSNAIKSDPQIMVKLKTLDNQLAVAKLNAITQMSDTEISTQGKVITAEATGGSWIQQNWRPVTMLVFVYIIANNYVIVPYLQALGFHAVSLTIVPDMWGLLKLGIGGYITSRGLEKISDKVTAGGTRSLLDGIKGKTG